MAELFRYAAFISYSSKDARFAQRLHRALESYGIPSSLGKFDLIGGGKKNRVYPVFRDREELSAGQLGEQIEANLKASAALIVVCSPNAAASPWVEKEIEFFAGLGRHTKIFSIISDDAPLTDSGGGDATASCFPPAFRGDALTGDKLEPLAADARKGKDGFRNAWLKIVAGMIGVSPGQLIDRDRARRAQQRFAVAAGLFALIGIGGVATTMVDARNWRTELTARASEMTSGGRHLEAIPFALAGLPARGDIVGVTKPDANEVVRRTGAQLRLIGHIGHVDSTYGEVFASGGAIAITYPTPDTASIHDLRGSEVRTRTFPAGTSIEVSPAAPMLLSWSDTQSLQLLNLDDMGPPRDLGPARYARFSEDGRFILQEGSDRQALLRDISALDAPALPLGMVQDLTWSAFYGDGRYLVVTTVAGCFLYDLQDLTEPPLPLGAVRGHFRVIVSPDLRFAINARGLRDLRGAAREVPLVDFKDFAFTADARYLVLQDGDDRGYVRDLSTGATSEIASIGRLPYQGVGNYVMMSAPSQIQRGEGEVPLRDWTLRSLLDGTQTPVGTLDYDVPYNFSVDGRFLVTVDLQLDGVFHDLRSGVTSLQIGQLGQVPRWSVSPDERYLLVRSLEGDQSVGTLYNLSEPTAPVSLGRIDFPSGFSKTGRYLVVENSEGDVRLHDLRDVSAPPTPLGRLEDFWFSPDDSVLLTVMSDNNAVVRDLRSDLAVGAGGALRARICEASGATFAPFDASARATLRRGLSGRPWNPCDWRGLLAIFPDAARGDGWFEGARQWWRLMSVRHFGGRDWGCEETTSAASEQTRLRRADMCARFAALEPAPT